LYTKEYSNSRVTQQWYAKTISRTNYNEGDLFVEASFLSE